MGLGPCVERCATEVKRRRSDITRNKKLLEQQKASKKTRQFGEVDIPKVAFVSALKMDSQNQPQNRCARG